MTDVLIYGGGAVGLGIASCLLASGARVDIIAREDTVTSLRANGLLRTGLFGDFHAGVDTFECHTSLDECQTGPYDFVLVCTKSFDSAADGLQPRSVPGKSGGVTVTRSPSTLFVDGCDWRDGA